MSRARASAAGLAAALLFGACGEDERAAAPAPATPTAATTPTPSPQAAGQALWPAPDAPAADPAAVARSFVVDYVGLEEPALSEFREGEPRAGEVDVFRRGEDGRALDRVVATISLRQLDGERWSVTSVQSPEVAIETPEALAAVASPARIAGRGRGFEGNVVLEVRAAFATEPLAQQPVTAGAMAKLEPFALELAFDRPDTPTGAILARTGSGIAAADGFAAVPVRF